jgi:UDP-N-acetylmuramoyl-L-alanyl-D-glutamate--2,6-diaminopimelate ligase
MTLAQLLDEPRLAELDSVRWSALQADSRRVMPGNIFVALKGATVDGRDYIADAIASGACAVITEAAAQTCQVSYRQEVPVIAVANLSDKLSAIAARAYSHPGAELEIIGITGTNGKTTCSLLIAQLLHALAERAAVVGTLGYGRVDEPLQMTGYTTPDAITCQAVLRDLAEQRMSTVAMEISSHALALGRVAAVPVTTAVFTNLSHDHLDFHGSLKAYGKAKAQLLGAPGLRCAVINLDDPWCQSLRQQAEPLAQVLSYSVASPAADLYFTELTYTTAGLSGTLQTPAGVIPLQIGLMGEFNASNVLAAIAVALSKGYALADIAAASRALKPAPGRMQPVHIQPHQDVQVVVDYAHTPDALEKALRALRQHTQGRLWCVFGCGGDRDREKRALMGRIAEKSADYAIVTNDNPRSEDPAAIASDIVRGMHNPEHCLVIAERDKAIDLAVQQARPGDTVLLAGKGHEAVQIFANQQLPFSDVQQARLALIKRADKPAPQGAL